MKGRKKMDILKKQVFSDDERLFSMLDDGTIISDSDNNIGMRLREIFSDSRYYLFFAQVLKFHGKETGK